MNWDYIAGLFDGEGSTTLNPTGHHSGRRSPSASVGITIYNTNRDVLNRTRDFCGYGHVRAVDAPSHRKVQWNRCYTFTVHSHSDILGFCEKVRPRSIIKMEKLIQLEHFIREHKWGRTPGPRSDLWDAKLEAVRRLYWDVGLSMREIAEEYGTTAASVSQYMKRKGIPHRPRLLGHINPVDVQRLYWGCGKTAKEIAAIYRVTDCSILRFMCRHGIARRPAGPRQVKLNEVPKCIQESRTSSVKSGSNE